MKILCITHADFESPGIIETWANEHKHHFIIKKPYQQEILPEITSFDLLIVMGGPQSFLKLHEFPYLAEEVRLIKNCIQYNKPIVGFCLGAQLIGEAFGSSTEKSPEKEVGVYPITLTPEGEKDKLFEGFPTTFPAIHWHNDMPGLTDESVVLAKSLGCPRQIIKYKNNVYGFQCHLEMTLENIKTMIQAVPEDLAASKYTQTEEVLLAQNYELINSFMVTILERLSI